MFMHIICISCAFKVETPPKFSEGFYKKPCIPKGTIELELPKNILFFKKIGAVSTVTGKKGFFGVIYYSAPAQKYHERLDFIDSNF